MDMNRTRQMELAAPDLLKALKELRRVVAGTLQGYGVLRGPMQAADAAIEKAEGAAAPAQRETDKGSDLEF